MGLVSVEILDPYRYVCAIASTLAHCYLLFGIAEFTQFI